MKTRLKNSKLNVIRFGGPKSEMISELKKSISRVALTHDYEVRLMFPSDIFGTPKKIGVNTYNDKLVKPNKTTNLVVDDSPGQYYNLDTIDYVEERLPFLTKSVGSFDHSVKTTKRSILNRDWDMPIGADFQELTITFYDMYVQDTSGIFEGITVSEYFKRWIDNIFYNENKPGSSINNEYTTVSNYFTHYAIPKLELMQFSRRLELQDIQDKYNGGKPFNSNQNFNMFKTKVMAGEYAELLKKFEVENQDHYLAGYLNELQKNNSLSGGFSPSSVIDTITAVLTPITNMINTAALAGDFIDDFRNSSRKYVGNFDEFMNRDKEIVEKAYADFTYRARRLLENEAKNGGNIKPTYDLTSLLNDEVMAEVSHSAIVEKIDDAGKAPGVKIGKLNTPLDEVVSVIAASSTLFFVYNLGKKVKDKFKADNVMSPNWEYGGIVKSDNSVLATIATGIAGDAVNEFMNIKFTDTMLTSINTFLIKTEANLQKLNPELFKIPLNFDAIGNLSNDERYSKSTILDKSFNKDTDDDIYVNPIKTFIFYDVYPTKIVNKELSYDSEKELTTFDITFAYTHYDQK